MRKRDNTGGLIKLLTALLLACTIAEAGIAFYVGVTMQINRQANEEAITRYEEYQEQRQQEREEPSVVDYVGPNVHVKDGQVVKGAMPGTATTRTVAVQPDLEPATPQEPVQQDEPDAGDADSQPEAQSDKPEPSKEPATQPAAEGEKPKSSAKTSKASDGVKAATPAPEPSGGQSNSGTSSQQKSSGVSSGSGSSAKKEEPPQRSTNSAVKSSGGNSEGGRGNANNFNAHNNLEQQNTEAMYVLNTNTKKFHYPSCNDVKKIAEKNYSTSNDSRDSIINSGYSPCGHCSP